MNKEKDELAERYYAIIVKMIKHQNSIFFQIMSDLWNQILFDDD